MNAETKTIRILTVDDHALLREGIASLVEFEPDMELVAQASTGREAIEQFRRHQPDITLMDLQMPDISGIEAIIAIRGEFPDARIIVLTTYAGDVQVVRALKAGARGYLLKGNVHTDLLETIRAVHAGHKTDSAGGRGRVGHAYRRGPVDRARTGGFEADREGERKQGDRRPAFDSRGYGEKATSPTSSRSWKRTTARTPSPSGLSAGSSNCKSPKSGVRRPPFVIFQNRCDSRKLKSGYMCNGFSPPSRTAGLAPGF